MPASLFIPWEDLKLNEVACDKDTIYQRMPQSYEFKLLDAICMLDVDTGLAVAMHDCKPDEWWVRGHIPERPIFPGVLQLEAAAQITAFLTHYAKEYEGFVAFGGVEQCRFREIVQPPDRFVLICKVLENRKRRVRSTVQGVVEGRLVFEAQIIGMPATIS